MNEEQAERVWQQISDIQGSTPFKQLAIAIIADALREARNEAIKEKIEIIRTDYDGRYIFKGPLWDEWEGNGGYIPFCIHGEKRTWVCDKCNAMIVATEPEGSSSG